MNIIIILALCALIYAIYIIIQKLRLHNRVFSLKENLDKLQVKSPFQIHDYFHQIIAVVLPKRKKYFTSAVNSHGISPKEIKIMEAIPKDSLKMNDLIKKSIIIQPLQLGKIACHLSHMNALKEFISTSNPGEICLILEDDIQHSFNKFAFQRRIQTLSEELKSVGGKWDVLFLGKCHDNCTRYEFLSPQIATNTTASCRHAYVVTHMGAIKLINNLLPMVNSGDKMTRNLIMENKINALAAHPSLFYQNRDLLGSLLDNYDDLQECNNGLHYGGFGLNPWYKISVMMYCSGPNVAKKYQKYEIVDEVVCCDCPTKNKAILHLKEPIIIPEEELVDLANSLLCEPEKTFHFQGGYMATKKKNKNY